MVDRVAETRMNVTKDELRKTRAWIAENHERYRAMEKESAGTRDRQLAEAFRQIGKLTVNVPTSGESACYVLGRVRQIVETALEPDVFRATYEATLRTASELAAIAEPHVPSPSLARQA